MKKKLKANKHELGNIRNAGQKKEINKNDFLSFHFNILDIISLNYVLVYPKIIHLRLKTCENKVEL